MKREDIEKYVKVIELRPEAKYILIVSRDSGLRAEDLQKLKLNDQFLDEMLLIEGNPNEVIRVVERT